MACGCSCHTDGGYCDECCEGPLPVPGDPSVLAEFEHRGFTYRVEKKDNGDLWLLVGQQSIIGGTNWNVIRTLLWKG